MATQKSFAHCCSPGYVQRSCGVSWVVAPNGRISSQTSAFTELARVATAPLLAVETWYVRGGWIFRWLCVLVALLASIWGWRREP